MDGWEDSGTAVRRLTPSGEIPSRRGMLRVTLSTCTEEDTVCAAGGRDRAVTAPWLRRSGGSGRRVIPGAVGQGSWIVDHGPQATGHRPVKKSFGTCPKTGPQMIRTRASHVSHRRHAVAHCHCHGGQCTSALAMGRAVPVPVGHLIARLDCSSACAHRIVLIECSPARADLSLHRWSRPPRPPVVRVAQLRSTNNQRSTRVPRSSSPGHTCPASPRPLPLSLPCPCPCPPHSVSLGHTHSTSFSLSNHNFIYVRPRANTPCPPLPLVFPSVLFLPLSPSILRYHLHPLPHLPSELPSTS